MIVMGNLDGNLEKIAFDSDAILRIITRYEASLVSASEVRRIVLEMNDSVFPVKGMINKDAINPYFIILTSGTAFNVCEYQILFEEKNLTDNLLMGVDVAGNKHLCNRYISPSPPVESKMDEVSIADIDERFKKGEVTNDDIEALKFMIKKLRNGDFFELLTMEFSGKIREVALELIDFRKSIQERIEPDIVKIAAQDIPEASIQLEGINETLEDSTMKIMDINEALMEMAGSQVQALKTIISGNGTGKRKKEVKKMEHGVALEIIEQEIDVLQSIQDKSLMMMEPLSFQDLVGQRIQKIIRLVRSMEFKIEEMIVSFGIKLQKHREDPTKTYHDLNKDVEMYMSELKGPQRAGAGLDQEGIDELLASL